jgi:hypothetical protein
MVDEAFITKYDMFCDNEMQEKTIFPYGTGAVCMKLMNVIDKIYIMSRSAYELDGFDGPNYREERKKFDAINEEIQVILLSY